MSLKTKAYKFTALSLLLAPMALSTFQGVTVMATDHGTENPAPAVDPIPVTLHKLLNTNKFDVQNTGDIMTADKFYTGDTPKMIKLPGVTFAAYDITTVYYRYRAAGMTVKTAVEAIELLSKTFTVEDNGSLMLQNELVAESAVETQKTDSNGEANFSNLEEKSGDKDAVYIFMETDAPDGITQKANPMVLVLPAYKYDAEGNITDIPLDEINLYPKNSSKLGKLTADKYLQYYDGAEEDKLNEHLINGVQFVIHKEETDINNYKEGDAIFLGPIDGATGLRPWVTRDKAYIFTTEEVEGKNGQLTADNLAVNNYLLSEISSSVGVGDKENTFGKNSTVINREFSITQNPDGTIVNAALTGTSGGLINDDIIIEKDNTGGDFQYGDVESYVASTVIPRGMADQITKLDAEDKPVLSPLYTNYSFTDTYSEWLVFDESSLKVVIDAEFDEDGNYVTDSGIVLEKDTDYTLDTNTDNTFVVDFPTPYDTLGEHAGKEISLIYAMSLKPGAPADEDFNNEIINESDFDSDTDEGEEVYTGGRKFIKVDGHSETRLNNAQFNVIRNVIESTEEGDLAYIETLYENEEGKYEFFEEHATIPSGYTKKVLTSKTVEINDKEVQGVFEIEGLEYGEYELKEIAVPDSSYILPDGTFKFEVSANSYKTADEVKIANFSKGTLPSTGGMGTIVFFLVGAVAMTGVVAVSRKKKA